MIWESSCTIWRLEENDIVAQRLNNLLTCLGAIKKENLIFFSIILIKCFRTYSVTKLGISSTVKKKNISIKNN